MPKKLAADNVMESLRELLDLFQTGNISKEAFGRRMRIVRKLTADTIEQRAIKMGTTTNNLQSLESAASGSHPNTAWIGWVMDNTPADANFIVSGEYTKLTYEAIEQLAAVAYEIPYNK